MSLLQEIEKSKDKIQQIRRHSDTFSNKTNNINIVRQKIDKDIDIMASTDEINMPAILIEGTVFNEHSTKPAVEITGVTNGTSRSTVHANNLGYTIPYIIIGDDDYLLSADNTNGIVLYYSLPLTTTRILYLPIIDSRFAGADHITIYKAPAIGTIMIDSGLNGVIHLSTTSKRVISSTTNQFVTLQLIRFPNQPTIWYVTNNNGFY